MTETASKKTIKRPSKGQRTHNRRVKAAARKGPEIIKPKRTTTLPVTTVPSGKET